MYDKIEDIESQFIEARAKKQAIEEALSLEVQIYEEKQPNGQWFKSISFKLPIIEEDMNIGLDDDTHVGCVALLHYPTKGFRPLVFAMDKLPR